MRRLRLRRSKRYMLAMMIERVASRLYRRACLCLCFYGSSCEKRVVWVRIDASLVSR